MKTPKFNRPGKRGGDRMASTSKTITSPKSDRHLMNEKDLSDDSETQTMGHTNAIRVKNKLPKLESQKALLEKEYPAAKDLAERDPVSRSFDEGDELGIENGELIVAQEWGVLRLMIRRNEGRGGS